MNLLLMLFFTFFGAGIFIGIIFAIVARKLNRLRKRRILWINGDEKSVVEEFIRTKDGRFRKGDKEYLLDGLSKHTGDHATWLVDPEAGWTYRAPTRKETYEASLQMAVLEPSNPATYHKAIRRKRWDDLLQSGADADKYRWVPAVALIGLLALILCLAALAWIVTHLPVPQGAA